MRDHRTSTNDGSGSDPHTIENRHVSADPHVILNGHATGFDALFNDGCIWPVSPVIGRHNYRMRGDENAVANDQPAVAIKHREMPDEDRTPDPDLSVLADEFGEVTNVTEIANAEAPSLAGVEFGEHPDIQRIT